MRPSHCHRLITAMLIVVLAALGTPQADAFDVYLANENHTDYGWNATVAEYEASMLSELDFYLARIAASALAPPAEQARFVADSWYYLWLYQQRRSPAQFAELLDAMRSGHITVPLNPLVTLFGALPTEAAIRAGYYPGRIERAHGVGFLHAEYMENQTVPWGLASIWAGSGVKYSWRGICGCATGAPYLEHKTDVFRWLGPDGKEILMKWYEFSGITQSWGGYAEARLGLADTPLAKIQTAIDHFDARGQTSAGLFGYGWDDVNSETDAIIDAVQLWNSTHPGGDRAVVSNVIDYFQALEGQRNQLPALRGGWGNDWDLWPAAMSAPTSQTRRAIERLRTVEAFAAFIHPEEPGFWDDLQPTIETGLLDYYRYFEHAWAISTAAPKRAWADAFDDVVSQADSAATDRLAGLFSTNDEDRFAVFNPLAFARTDYADVPVTTTGPFVVTDVASGTPVPSQLIVGDTGTVLRVLARNVPSLGYRVYRYATGSGEPVANAATITGGRIENEIYRLDVGTQGQITSLVDKRSGHQLVATSLNDLGIGPSGTVTAEDVGPVSATIRVDVPGQPARRVHVTLLREVERVEIDDEILGKQTNEASYRFDFDLTAPDIRFEEVGAIARPGLAIDGGDFLPGTRGDFMTLNHFVSLAAGGFHVVLSNWDGFAMRIGDSASHPYDFDLPTSTLSVLGVGNPASSDILDQGGDSYFRNRFALIPDTGPASNAAAMRASLAHQNPLRAITLPRNQQGPFDAPSAGWLSIDAANVVVTAFKPAEEGERGLILRAWELDGEPTSFSIDVSQLGASAAYQTTLIETDLAAAPLAGGQIQASIGANEIKTYRIALLPAAIASPTATVTSPPPTPTTSPTRTVTRTVTRPPSSTATRSPLPPASGTATARATSPTATPPATPTVAPGATRTVTYTPSLVATSTALPTASPTMTAPLTSPTVAPPPPTPTIATPAATRTGPPPAPTSTESIGLSTATVTPTVIPPTPPAARCAGDCNADLHVGVDELVLSIDIALGQRPLTECRAADANSDSTIGIDEIVSAVHSAVADCR